MAHLALYVVGIPKPQGSKRAWVNSKTGRAIIADNDAKMKDWRIDVQTCARHEMKLSGQEITGQAVELALEFIMPRPKYLETKKARSLPTPPHVQKPDLDKLERAILDALTFVVYHDDSQVNKIVTTKRTAEPGEDPGVVILANWTPKAVGQ